MAPGGPGTGLSPGASQRPLLGHRPASQGPRLSVSPGKQGSGMQSDRNERGAQEQVGGLTRTASPASQQHPPHCVSYPLPLATLDLVQIPQPYTRTPGALCAEEN